MQFNEEKFDMTVMRSYFNEIFEYKNMVSYAIRDSISSLLFWRPQVKTGNGHFPLHSFVAFYACINFVERPRLILPFFFFSIAWVMLACMSSRMNHPSPWSQCNSFIYYLDIMRFGRSSDAFAKDIAPHTNDVEAKAYNDAWAARKEKDRILAATKAELDQKMNEIGNERIRTELQTMLPVGLQLELLARLDRWQSMIGGEPVMH